MPLLVLALGAAAACSGSHSLGTDGGGPTMDGSSPCGAPPAYDCVTGTAGGACGDSVTRPVCNGTGWGCSPGMIRSELCGCVGRPPPGCTCSGGRWVCGGADAGARPDAGRDAGSVTVDAGSGCPDPGTGDGTPCAVEGTICGGGCTDMCSACSFLECTMSVWTRTEVLPPPCFTCEGGRSCVSGAEYCRIVRAAGGATSTCEGLPAACGATPSCACLPSSGDVCTVDADGNVTVELLTP